MILSFTLDLSRDEHETCTVPKFSDIENVEDSILNTEPIRSVQYRFRTDNDIYVLAPHQYIFYTLQPSNFDFLKLDIEGIDQLQEVVTLLKV